jgi:hypothetical protein
MRDGAIYLHAMFRTGSTFLAARFAADARFRLFYEPFHADLASPRRLAREAAEYQARRLALGHDALDGGYFGAYAAPDPATGRSVRQGSRWRFSVHDPLNDLSAAGLAFLEACGRAGGAEGRRPVFGFCRSGLQVGSMRAALPGRHLHLWRDPRHQFASYRPGRNDYFLPQTLLQLLASRSLAPVALALAQLPPGLPTLVRAASRGLPPPLVARLGRRLARGLGPEDGYALFYLGWLACFEHARAQTELSFSLSGALASVARRRAVEAALGVRLDGLRPIDRDGALLDLDHGAVERRVEARLSGEAADHRGHRERVALGAEAGDHRGRGLGHERTVIDRLAAVDVREVELDDRAGAHFQRVEDRDRGEAQARGVDDDAGLGVDRLVDPADDLALVVRLAELERVRPGGVAAHRLDLGKRGAAVDLGLAGAEPVQVRAVQHVDG